MKHRTFLTLATLFQKSGTELETAKKFKPLGSEAVLIFREALLYFPGGEVLRNEYNFQDSYSGTGYYFCIVGSMTESTFS